MIAARLHLPPKVRARLYRRVASLTRAGIPLPKALDLVCTLESGPLGRILRLWRARVYDGHSFGAALAGWVPAREWMVVEAGSQDLAAALTAATGLIDRAGELAGAVGEAVLYPLFLVALVLALLWIFGAEAIPAFAAVKPVEEWTGGAAAMAAVATGARRCALPLAGLIAGLGLAILWSLPRWQGEWRRRLDRLPPWSFYRLLAGAGFLLSLLAFLKTGMPVPEALRRLRPPASPWLRERIDAAIYHVNSGYHLGDALHLSGYDFPDRTIVEDLRVFAALGTFDAALERIVADWLQETCHRLKRIAGMAKLLGMALVAAAIAWIQGGIFAIQHQLTTPLGF